MKDDVDLAYVGSRAPKCGHAGGKRDHFVDFRTAGQVLTFVLLGWVFKF